MSKRREIGSHGIQEMKRRIRSLERLVGTLIIADEGQIITVQRADREKQKRQMRNKV
jgi:hypothetical protein